MFETDGKPPVLVAFVFFQWWQGVFSHKRQALTEPGWIGVRQ